MTYSSESGDNLDINISQSRLHTFHNQLVKCKIGLINIVRIVWEILNIENAADPDVDTVTKVKPIQSDSLVRLDFVWTILGDEENEEITKNISSG